MTLKERRKHNRYPSIHLSYVCLDENQEIVQQSMGRTLNLSEKGLLLETHFAIDPKYTILLEIGLQDDTVEIKGRIIYSTPLDSGKYGTGIEILQTDRQGKDVWEHFIQANGVESTSSTPGT